ncbi:prohibitin family protein [Salmonella enterica]
MATLEKRRDGKGILLIIICGCITLFAITIIMGSWYTINQGERGVKLRYGKLIEIASPGLGFKIPIIESIEKVSIRSHSAVYNQLSAYSKDQQPAVLQVSINYHVLPGEVEVLYNTYGSIENMQDRLISRLVPTQVENTFGQYTAISAVQERAKLVQDLTNALRASVQGPLVIDSVQVENIDFSDSYEKSVEARMQAEVAVETRRQNLETEKVQAQIAVAQAQAIADSKLALAKSEAEATRLKGAADAEAIKLRGDALRENPKLVELTTAERWNGALPTTMIPGGATPFINTTSK